MLANWFDDDAILRQRQAFMAREFDVHWQLLSHDELGAYTRRGATPAACWSPTRSTSIR